MWSFIKSGKQMWLFRDAGGAQLAPTYHLLLLNISQANVLIYVLEVEVIFLNISRKHLNSCFGSESKSAALNGPNKYLNLNFPLEEEVKGLP